MGKTYRLLLAVIFSLSISACGGGDEGSTPSPNPTPTPSPNNAPTLSLGQSSVSLEESQTTDITVDAQDEDGDNLFYSVTSSNAAVSGSVSGGTFTITADEVDADLIATVTLSVSDGKASTSKKVTVEVKDKPNTIPTLVLEKSEISLSANATAEVEFTASDADGDQLSYSLSSTSSVVSASISGEHLVISASDVEIDTTSTLTVTVSDGQDAASAILKISITKRSIVALKIETDTNLIIANGTSSATLNVIAFDENNDVISNPDYKFVANGIVQSGKDFKASIDGDYDIYAKSGEIESESVSITARENIQYTEVSIPIIFHILHFDEEIGTGNNLSQQKIQETLDELNDAFANRSGSTNPNAVDMRVTFRLASYDQAGLLLDEPGIDRFDGTDYDNGDNNGQNPGNSEDIAGDRKFGANEDHRLNQVTYWDPRKYKNVWIMPTVTSSYARTYPTYNVGDIEGIQQAYDDQLEPHDENFDSMTVGTQMLSQYTIAHEMGHALGLMHVFSNDSCLTSDYSADTLSYDQSLWDSESGYYGLCSENLGLNVHDNFLDYTGDFNTFTYDQRERVHKIFQHGIWIDELINSNK
ncbi:exported protein of unknown function [Shewanella benthica]|uniref:Cadherin domain-containing protein n=2 Tax=Alteromonadales TaxID=135622 RepID=A0A330MDH2_9GAMM|nr:M43 family zinc metalloprotease [Shewanella benthica]SQH77827.1 exported protein of unknown function [Shewanella benthica]